MTLLELLTHILLTLLSLATAYLWFLALLGMVARRRHPSAPVMRCAILVPAHDEEGGIRDTIASLLRLDDARGSVIYVIADNCSDGTAEVARQFPVEVLERVDPENRGKGYALEWAVEQIELSRFDAVVVIDADTIVGRDLLSAVSRSLAVGFGAVQMGYFFKASGGSALAYLQEIASATENRLFYNGRAVAGLPILLRGNGMAVSTGVLREHPWDSHSITEDVDYAVNLHLAGVTIDFSMESAVCSSTTVSYEQSTGQKERWAAGTFALIRDKFGKLIGRGLRTGRLELLELALSLLLLSRPLLLYVGAAGLILGWLVGGESGRALAAWAATLVCFLVAYLLAGWLFVADKWRAFKAILHIPIYAVWFLIVQVKALLGHRKEEWVRTERKD